MGRAGGERRSREMAGMMSQKNPLAPILFIPKYAVEDPKHQHLREELIWEEPLIVGINSSDYTALSFSQLD